VQQLLTARVVQCALDRLQAHEERFRVRLRHARAEVERLGIVFEASQDGLTTADVWTDTDHCKELVAGVGELEQQSAEGSKTLQRGLRQAEMQLLAEESSMLEHIKKSLAESPEGLDHWFVQSDSSSAEELSRDGFPSNQEAVLFQVEEAVAGERQLLEDQKQNRMKERQTRERAELERLRLLEMQVCAVRLGCCVVCYTVCVMVRGQLLCCERAITVL
jgi:hypothetical protein